jgi:3-isopropylmalate/(R)-2-methylmalate dehydratase small subunit
MISRPLEGRAGEAVPFSIDPFFRECLLNGWDEVALTLRDEAAIAHYEAQRSPVFPSIR